MELHDNDMTVTPPGMRLEDRICASLLGGAIADAMGWVTEFIRSPQQLLRLHGVERLTHFVRWEKKTEGRFHSYVDVVGAGEYSDDTQLTLCVARSIQADGTVDNVYFGKQELPSWLAYARGGGATTIAAGKALQRKRAAWNRNFFRFQGGTVTIDYRASGTNGAAMRIGPIAMANPYDPQRVSREVWRNAIVTHGHPRAIVGALVYAHALTYMLSEATPRTDTLIHRLEETTRGISFPDDDADLIQWRQEWAKRHPQDFDALLKSATDEMLKILNNVQPDRTSTLRDLYAQWGCFESSTKGSGVATVGAAIATFLRYGNNYKKAVLEAVNMLGADTDTIAAMVGGLTGAHAGYSAIPEKWAERIQDFAYFMHVGSALSRIAHRDTSGPELRTAPRELDEHLATVDSLVTAPQLTKHQGVKHPILGRGIIECFEVHPLRSRPAGSNLFISVAFDCGQTCKFKFFRPSTILPRRRSKNAPRHLGL